MTHDEQRYPNPDSFDPNRFLTTEGNLDPNVPDPEQAFGFGRRICAGRHFADDLLFLAIANILATFTIEPPVDENGKKVEPSGEFQPGLLR